MSDINILYSHISDLCNQSIPKRIGAYVITHTFDNIYAEKYVGSTKNLYNRIHGHCNKEMIYIDIFITDDILVAQSLERILMELIEPATNSIIYPLSDRDIELMNELLDTNIKEHTSNNIVKIGYRYLKYIDHNKRYLSKRTKKLNIKIEKSYLDSLNIFKVSSKSEIELRFKKSDQQTAVQYIILEYMKLKNLTHLIEILENNKDVEI